MKHAPHAGASALRFARHSFALAITLGFGPALAAETTPSVQLDTVEVIADAPHPISYHTRNSSTATRTDTPLVDVPQAVSVVNRAQVQDQSAQNIGDVVRYVPGVAMAQGEGNRETPVLRGNATTSDFFVNGLRDDVQYYRDLYNIERIEILKGPNAMIFGRGGVGGVINRVTRVANFSNVSELSLQAGVEDNKRVTADVGRAFNEHIAGRVTALYEDGQSYRDGVTLQRQGINPTLALRPGKNTTVTLAYEYFQDERVADRGVASQNGKPFPVKDSVFFGNPAQSPTDTELNISSMVIDHQFGNGLSLRNRTLYGSYDKFYQNVFASSAVAANGDLSFQAYFAATERQNLFNQTDLIYKLKTGRIEHTLLAGVELGRQRTDNLRLSGQFADGPDGNSDLDTTFVGNVSNPTISEPLVGFIQGGSSDGNNESITTIAAIYLQDQIVLSSQLEAVIGLRFDQYDTDFLNRRTGVAPADREIKTEDGLLSPRLGLIYKPLEQASVYASYSLSYLPRSGEQLGSLTLSNAAFDPEEYKNYEVGAKWDLRPDLALTAAVYQLDRSNVIIPPVNSGDPSTLGDGARSKGIELGVSGNLTKAWSMAGGYAYQQNKLTATTSGTAQAGASLANLPRNTFSLWNRYDFTPQWGAGVGIYNRSATFASTSNAVKLDGYTRVDGAVFYRHSPTLRAQLNVENLLGEDYFVNAHNDNNILPGAPVQVRVAVTANF